MSESLNISPPEYGVLAEDSGLHLFCSRTIQKVGTMRLTVVLRHKARQSSFGHHNKSRRHLQSKIFHRSTSTIGNIKQYFHHDLQSYFSSIVMATKSGFQVEPYKVRENTHSTHKTNTRYNGGWFVRDTSELASFPWSPLLVEEVDVHYVVDLWEDWMESLSCDIVSHQDFTIVVWSRTWNPV